MGRRALTRKGDPKMSSPLFWEEFFGWMPAILEANSPPSILDGCMQAWEDEMLMEGRHVTSMGARRRAWSSS